MGSFLNSIYKEWMAYQKASARFLLDRIPLIDQRCCRPGRSPDDADGVQGDERDDELAAEQAAGDVAVNVMVELPQTQTWAVVL